MVSTELTLGFSPCPNDTFIFEALINGRIDTEGLRFKPWIADVEELNRAAAAGELDVTKLSAAALSEASARYAVLDAGAALGRGCGPLLVARDAAVAGRLHAARVAIPGARTTAALLLRLYAPRALTEPVLFSEIEDLVAAGKFEAGVLIHETRFTYQQKGLICLADLGEVWEQRTGMPIPLGVIAVNRSLDSATQQAVQRIVRRSVEFVWTDPEASLPYIRQHAQAMDDDVMRRHIELYVNEFTRSLGDEGRRAILQLLAAAPQGEQPLCDNLFL